MTVELLDENIGFSPFTARAGNEAMGLYLRAISYCADCDPEGMFVPRWVAEQLAGDRLDELAGKLIDNAFWTPYQAEQEGSEPGWTMVEGIFKIFKPRGPR